jgi:hypothetical protein
MGRVVFVLIQKNTAILKIVDETGESETFNCEDANLSPLKPLQRQRTPQICGHKPKSSINEEGAVQEV